MGHFSLQAVDAFAKGRSNQSRKTLDHVKVFFYRIVPGDKLPYNTINVDFLHDF